MTTEPNNVIAGADRAAVAFHPPILLLLLIIAGLIGRWLVPAAFLPAGIGSALGAPVVVIAFAIFAWAIMTMRQGGASIPTHTPTDAIVASGPFRFSRNPIYLSMVLLLTGIGVWSNSLWFVAAAAVDAVLLNRYVIKPEERYLEQKFGEVYLKFRRSVRRWI